MRRLISTCFILPLLTIDSWAQGIDMGFWPSAGASAPPVTYMAAPIMIPAATSGSFPTNATRYVSVANGTPNILYTSATENQVAIPVPSNFNVTGLKVHAATGNAVAGSTWTFNVRKNGVTQGFNCVLTGNVTTPATDCVDNFGTTGDNTSFTTTTPDNINIIVVPSTTAPTASAFWISLLARSTSGQDAPLFATTGASVSLNGATSNMTVGVGGNLQASILPGPGHIDDLYFTTNVLPGAGISYTVTAFYGACGSEVATNLKATGAANAGSGSDTTATDGFDVAAGNCMYLQAGSTGAAASAFVNASVRWSIGGTSGGQQYQYPIFVQGSTLPGTVTGKWCYGQNAALCYGGCGGVQLPDLQDSNSVTRTATALNIAAFVTPTAGAVTRTFSFVAGNGTSGNPTCTIPASGTACGTSSGVSSSMAAATSYCLYNILSGAGTAGSTLKASYMVEAQ